MTKQAELVLMNLSKMAGGPGDLNHGKQIIQQMHNVEWTNAQTRLQELGLEKAKFNYMTKPLLKGVIMPPFLNEPTDLSIGEFATLMGSAVQWAGMMGQGGAPEWLLKDHLNRFQTLEEGLKKAAGNPTDKGYAKKLDDLRARAYNDPKSDYRNVADTVSRLAYASSPIFRTGPGGQAEPIPWEELPRDMTDLRKQNWFVAKLWEKKQTVLAPPAQAGFGAAQTQQADTVDYGAAQRFLLKPGK